MIGHDGFTACQQVAHGFGVVGDDVFLLLDEHILNLFHLLRILGTERQPEVDVGETDNFIRSLENAQASPDLFGRLEEFFQ